MENSKFLGLRRGEFVMLYNIDKLKFIRKGSTNTLFFYFYFANGSTPYVVFNLDSQENADNILFKISQLIKNIGNYNTEPLFIKMFSSQFSEIVNVNINNIDAMTVLYNNPTVYFYHQGSNIVSFYTTDLSVKEQILQNLDIYYIDVNA